MANTNAVLDAQITKSFNVQLQEEQTCDIEDIAALPTGGFVVCDRKNCCLKRVTAQGKVSVLCQVDEGREPWRVKIVRERDQYKLLVRTERIDEHRLFGLEIQWWFVTLDGEKQTQFLPPADCLSPRDIAVAPNGEVFFPYKDVVYVVNYAQKMHSKLIRKFNIEWTLDDPWYAVWVNSMLVLSFGIPFIAAYQDSGELLWYIKAKETYVLCPGPEKLYLYVAGINEIVRISNKVGKNRVCVYRQFIINLCNECFMLFRSIALFGE